MGPQVHPPSVPGETQCSGYKGGLRPRCSRFLVCPARNKACRHALWDIPFPVVLSSNAVGVKQRSSAHRLATLDLRSKGLRHILML